MSPILDQHSLEVRTRGAEQTCRVGVRLGQLLRGGEVICLEGPLGVGKTVLAQGIGEGWGSTTPLLSPSFVLIREHRRAADAQRLLHVDFYRLQGEMEARGLGLEEWLEDPGSVVLIEWPERAPGLLPSQRLWVRLEFAGEGDAESSPFSRRRLLFTAQGDAYLPLLRALRRAIFGG
ncbi:MAG: tRNA (adenosine(37)-N6)-threonylcarbamoyltransferase complex ATPase subunit type 1 TsaE [Thermoflexia bacterium]|nr:MAG: tRNA (adenosine(37)-N6)-threonylcarbamoyltransferase complex ATPase subunit type 1 TsaE [Thermoflexia bacterium]